MSLILFIAIGSLTVGCTFIPRMGDIYGRKKIYTAAIFAQIPIYFIAGYFSNIYLIYFAAFLLGPTVIARMACGFLLIMEQVPSKYQTAVGASIMIGEGMCQLIWTAYFVWISNNAFMFIWGLIVFTCVIAILTLFVAESPKWLFGVEQYDECRRVLA